MQKFCGGGEFILLVEGSNEVLLKSTNSFRFSGIVKKILTNSADYQFLNNYVSQWN
jgi:hypothetical protein